MFSFFGFGRTRRAKEEYAKANSLTETVSGKSRGNQRQGEMIRLALSRVLRRRGIESQSIGCELVPMVRPGAPDLMLTQLVILQWHEGLMRLAPHLEDELFTEIRLFDQGAMASDFLFLWKFALHTSYDKAGRLALASSLAVAATTRPTVKFDLPKSALDRHDNENEYDGFAPTLIASR